MSDRERVIREVTARAKAAKRSVYGYCSDKAGCAQAVRELPANWDRICVEGDGGWTYLPPAKEVAKG